MTQHTYDLAVTGTLHLSDHVIPEGTLLINAGRIVGLVEGDGDRYSARERVHASGKWIMPGFIDGHVHALSYPAEGFHNATRAAAAGGVTTIIDMPVDAPNGVADVQTLKAKIKRVCSESVVDVALLASVKNETIDRIASLAAEGVCGFKLSLFDTDPHRFPRVRDGHLYDAFSAIKQTGLSAGVHAENDEIITRLIARAIENGRTAPLDHCLTRPEVSETESVLKALEIARATGVHLHLYHVSCARSIELANWYKEQGSSVSAETCPHFLVFSQDDMQTHGPLLRINPPLRDKTQKEALWRRLARGDIDCVGSDHVAWPLEQKTSANIFNNACGCPGLETLACLLLSEGVLKGRLPVRRFTQILSETPARLFKLYPRKGSLMPGSDADITILDPEKQWRVSPGKMYSSAGWSPYADMRLTGSVSTTIVRGTVVYADGQIRVENGHGAFVRAGA